MNKKAINIVWFKRDLRFTDNEALFDAHQSGLPLLLIYIFEPSVMKYDDADVRHWRFIYESIQELQNKLHSSNNNIYFFHNEADFVFSEILKNFEVQNVFSHQEIGNKITFDRDIAMQGVKKQNLPNKICIVCNKPFAWRKKWEKVWNEVKYCSDKCRNNK